MIQTILILVLLFLLLLSLYRMGKVIRVTRVIIRKLAKEANVDALKILREIGID